MRKHAIVLLAVVAVVGCKKDAPAPATTNAAPAAAPMGAQVVTGTVVETLDAPSYTYLKLNTAQGEKWAAVPKAEVKVGASVNVAQQMVMTDFESKSLGRTFASIIFGTLADAAAKPAEAPAAAMGAPSAMGTPGAMGGGTDALEMATRHAMAAAGPEDVGDVTVPKAEGQDAHTVAEVHTERQALAGKPVVVRGKVVKVTMGVMGRNWIHLRDGSGDAGKRTNDLTVTSTDEAKVGDVVVASGTLQIDRDFGAGYTYPVIVEDTKITK